MLLTSSMLTALQQRNGGDHHWLAYITAKNRETGDPEAMGLWTGAYDAQFTIDGVAREYRGAGGLIGIDRLSFDEGLNVQVLTASVAIASEDVALLIRGYEPRQAGFDLHLALFEPGTEGLIDTVRVFRGAIDKAPIRRGAKGAAMYGTCELEVVSDARRGTRALAGKKSDAALRLRDPDDRGRRYANLTTTPVWGGDKGDNYWWHPK